MRRALLTLAAAAVAVLAASSSASAYINPTNAETPPGAGSCTISGATVPISSLQVSISGDARAEVSASGALVYDYSVVAYCGVNANGNNEFVTTRVVVPMQYAISDSAGTLTISGKTFPQSFTGDTFDGLTGTATLTSGYGLLPPVVYGADNSTEKAGVVSRHKTITAAKTNAARATALNQLQAYLS